ncbi:N-acetyl-beta-glucosaminyl-glycoprotein 4-beta-N-acetylgalactosaminyltransferase 1 [Bufo bufo]|uniref:N-acetyl-beta-glucosaminyl-glycoprotein 4-beta-N-acetylgalactosaminyltransferase 1 n=1 Tax=Bufo bufo TaxID=8384 RepID=UPI001ABE7749|nr:N-acetyl-beta-glucosaminyl-glycoprotein 4-beta-N-acetylgalactosaminyltransferase 1 [Bufo bufo]XP_040266251.1 N-acetyl-beta-glucosaminyl-glycoprotein 4-beta-N-acetylgalactosaminyltransferase 1 [Bufo bufo]
MPWLPVKKIRRQFKLLLLLVLLTSAVWVTYLHISLARQGKALRLPFVYSRDGERVEGTDPARKTGKVQASPPHSQAGDSSEELPTVDALGWKRSHHLYPSLEQVNLTDTPLPWDEKYKGKVNLHVFEDWCGGSVLHLKANLHFPLYPHTRTTVTKLAVSPKWKNYGLRIFGYIHPFKDGDFQFAVSSEDNSEFWLSTEESPSSAQLIASVGRVGTEWTAPGEFTKFSSQVSKPFRLMSSRRYYFELLHKQDDRGSDHVEVAWRLSLPGTKFEIVDAPHLSLYTDEASRKMNEIAHIPQTLSSVIDHRLTREEPTVDMLRQDPRDTFYMTPMIEQSKVENVLVPCAYSPTYVVKDFPIARYQGLQFVYLTFVYPNDFTRLTHMETENKCFYRESPVYLERFGFYKYMKMDDDDSPQMPFLFFNRQHFMDEDEDDPLLPGMSLKKNAEIVTDTVSPAPVVNQDTNIHYNDSLETIPIINYSMKSSIRSLLWAPRESPPSAHRGSRKRLMPLLRVGGQGIGDDPEPTEGKSALRTREEIYIDHRTKRKNSESKSRVRGRSGSQRRGEKSDVRNKHGKLELTEKRDNVDVRPSDESKPEVTTKAENVKQNSKNSNKQESDKVYVTRLLSGVRKSRGQVFPGMLLPKPKPRRTFRVHENHHYPTPPKLLHGGRRSRPWTPPDTSELGLFSWEGQTEIPGLPLPTLSSLPGGPPLLSLSSEAPAEELQDYSYEDAEPRQSWPEDAINWQRTFSVGNVDFEMLRSDWNDLRCNVSGNLQLSEAETVDVVAQYMEKLNEKNGGVYTLLRIINVEKRRDSARGNRYLIELELEERGRKKVRLAEYVYLLLHRGSGGDSDESPPAEPPEVSPSPSIYTKPILCRPVSLNWNPRATVHFVVPVKNQARWVQQLINDLELLYLKTHDDQFSLILVDYDSEDMDVEQALRRAKLPSYQYLKRSGNFERSAGLQAGVDTIQDNHSIVFLCDLHIHFPLSVLDSVRKHCVEGKLAFAPIVMRLSCGSSPRQPRGYWEVNGFGLFGIYKSDFDRIGGMNTEEFKDRWGGEDWELLDRVLQNGLEVERLRLRNFFHYYHSKRGMWNTQSQENAAKD